MSQVVRSSHARKNLVDRYLKAKEAVIAGGFEAEIDWQRNLQFGQMGESDILREAAWVILSAGMREAVIRVKFPQISKAFYFWQSAKRIVRSSGKCKARALSVFRHREKINAIISIAKEIDTLGFTAFKTRILSEGVNFIQTLPFMGPATSYHLGKNVGLEMVKPDRHLVRIAEAAGYQNPRELCEDISEQVGDRISVIDLVIWRFATLYPNYTDFFAQRAPFGSGV